MKTKTRKILYKLVITILVFGIGIVLAEGVVRYYWFGMNGFSYVKMNSFKPIGAGSGLIEKAKTEGLSWELKPNLDTVFKFSHFSTNSVGMRDREYEQNKPENTKRVAVIGDSFAMGTGVSDEETYPKQLELLLNKNGASSKVEVLNFGVGGYSLVDYDIVLKTKVLKYEPDLIILGFCGENDFSVPESLGMSEEERQESLTKAEERGRRDLFYMSYLEKEIKKARIARKNSKRGESSPDLAQAWTAGDEAYVEDFLGRISKETHVQNIPIVVAYYSLLPDNGLIDKVKRIALSNDLAFVDATLGMKNKEPEEMMFHPLDGHPNVETHQVYARNIFEFIKSQKLLEPRADE